MADDDILDDGPDCLPGGVHQAHCRDAGKPVTRAVSAKVIEVAATPLDALGIPVTSIKVELGEDRKAFIFTMSARARDQMTDLQLGSTAHMLGALVYPSSAALVVLPDGEQLGAYRVEVE